MRKLLLAAVLAAGPAFADLVATNKGGDEVRLVPSQCVHGGILGMLPEALRPKFKKAQATIRGTFFYACWADTGSGTYLILYEDGDLRAIPVTSFVEKHGV